MWNTFCIQRRKEEDEKYRRCCAASCFIPYSTRRYARLMSQEYETLSPSLALNYIRAACINRNDKLICIYLSHGQYTASIYFFHSTIAPRSSPDSFGEFSEIRIETFPSGRYGEDKPRVPGGRDTVGSRVRSAEGGLPPSPSSC